MRPSNLDPIYTPSSHLIIPMSPIFQSLVSWRRARLPESGCQNIEWSLELRTHCQIHTRHCLEILQRSTRWDEKVAAFKGSLGPPRKKNQKADRPIYVTPIFSPTSYISQDPGHSPGCVHWMKTYLRVSPVLGPTASWFVHLQKE